MANVYKVWDSTRQKRKSVLANGLEDLRKKAADKLQLKGDLVCVLEKDGTEIDEDAILDTFKTEVFMVLEEKKSWKPDSVVLHAAEVWEGMPMEAATTSETSLSTATTTSESISVSTAVTATTRDGTGDLIPSFINTQKLSLPQFSDYVQARLHSGDGHICWNKMVEEAAYYYLGKYPNFGKDNGAADYKVIGQKMVQTYSCIKRPGSQSWSCFTKALSQKIRSIRHNQKTKSTLAPTKSLASPKQLKLNTSQNVTNSFSDHDEHYTEHVEEMRKESSKPKHDKVHLKQLIQQTYKQRREWIGKQPEGKSSVILEKFPWLVMKSYMLLETKLILNVEHLQPYVTRLEKVFQAVSELKPGGKECEDDLDVIRGIETQTGFKHGKGSKSRSIVALHKNVEEANLDKVLGSKANSPPSLVLLFNDTECDKQYIIGDQCKVPLETENLMEGLFLLLCYYYILDLEYPCCYSQVLGFFQQTVFQQAFLSQKSTGFLHYLEKVEKYMTKDPTA